MNLHEYDLVIANSSAGKDSLCMLWELCRIADEQGFCKSRIVVSHQELIGMEWNGVKELVIKQAEHLGLKHIMVRRRNKEGREEHLLEYVERRGKWPSSAIRYCTSDFKRAPGCRVVTALTTDLGKCKVLHTFGFRASESPARAKRIPFIKNKNLTTKKREVFDWLPVHTWSDEMVWKTIKENSLPYHFAYDLGMPRLSCVFCVFSPFDALVLAGIHNRELLDKYVEVEKKINHKFRADMSIESVRNAIIDGYQPKKIVNWIM